MDEPKETDRLTNLQKKTDTVTSIARGNLEKVIRRGDNIEDLQDRAENLRLTSSEFDVSSKRLKRKYCWQNIKLWIILLVVLIVIVVVLIVALVLALRPSK